MKKIKINQDEQKLDNSNKALDFEDNERLYYNKFKFYRYLTFFLIIIYIPIIIAIVKITKRITKKKIESNIELKFNYINRNVNSIVKGKESKVENFKPFNLSSKNFPKLPEFREEHLIKKSYSKISYNKTNIKYNFEDLYTKRNLFIIDYSDDLYQQIDKSMSFDEIANQIFEKTGMLNITKLELNFYNIKPNTADLNHIHIAMSFDNNYILLSSISIVSILDSSSNDTFIHFHIILNNCKFEDIKPIIELKKINQKVSFIFYNGKQAEYDFNRGINEERGVGEYSRFLIPQIVNNTNKILILDSGDILAIRDLSEIFFFELEDNYFAFTIEDVAGRYVKDVIFGRNNFYPNGGVTLINVRKFREDKLYKSAFFASLAYENFPCPYQDILFMISSYKFKIFPLNFNCIQFYESKEIFIKNNFTSKEINKWMTSQNLSPFKYTKDEIINAALDPVIVHFYKNKPFLNDANEVFTEKWINYAKMTNLFENIKQKYPKPFQKRDK